MLSCKGDGPGGVGAFEEHNGGRTLRYSPRGAKGSRKKNFTFSTPRHPGPSRRGGIAETGHMLDIPFFLREPLPETKEVP